MSKGAMQAAARRATIANCGEQEVRILNRKPDSVRNVKMKRIALFSVMMFFLFSVSADAEETVSEAHEVALGQFVSEALVVPDDSQAADMMIPIFSEEIQQSAPVNEESEPSSNEEITPVDMTTEQGDNEAIPESECLPQETKSELVRMDGPETKATEQEMLEGSDVHQEEGILSIDIPPEAEEQLCAFEVAGELIVPSDLQEETAVEDDEYVADEMHEPPQTGEEKKNLPEFSDGCVQDAVECFEIGAAEDPISNLTEAFESETNETGEEKKTLPEFSERCVTDAVEYTGNTDGKESAQEQAESDVMDVLSETVILEDSSSGDQGRRNYITRLYRTVFHRNPDAQGLQFWVGSLEDGKQTAASVVDFFFNSTEYKNAEKTNDQIVTDVYNTMLDRPPDEAGFTYWKQYLDIGMTPQSLLAGFVQSKEFTALTSSYGIKRGEIVLIDPLDKNFERTYFVYRLYENCLDRKPDLAGERFWCKQLDGGGTGSQVAASFFFSDEFYKKRYNNSTFVEYLYKAIHGREFDTDGLIYWTYMLNYSDTREKVMNCFIDSEEFKKQCTAAQISPGSPISTPDDTVEWKYNIAVLTLCNQYRRQNGLKDLYTREDLLYDVALNRAMETTVRFSHTRPDGSSCFTLFRQEGFYGHSGENIAAGTPYADPETIVEAWMNSEGHRANILDENYTYLATGYVYDPNARTYCEDGKYKGQRVSFRSYGAQTFCEYGVEIN